MQSFSFMYRKSFKISYFAVLIITLLAIVPIFFSCKRTDSNNDKDIVEMSDEVEKQEEELYNVSEKNMQVALEMDQEKYNQILEKIYAVNNIVGGDSIISINEYIENKDMNLSIIGDSVTEAARESLQLYMPNAIINAEGYRQLKDAVSVFNEMKDRSELGDAVVIALGTNSDSNIRVDVLEEIYNNIGDRPMIILTILIPYVMQELRRNDDIKKFVSEHENCYIADWHGIMKTHEDCFEGDDTHPKGTGRDAYAQIIFKTVFEILNS